MFYPVFFMESMCESTESGALPFGKLRHSDYLDVCQVEASPSIK